MVVHAFETHSNHPFFINIVQYKNQKNKSIYNIKCCKQEIYLYEDKYIYEKENNKFTKGRNHPTKK